LLPFHLLLLLLVLLLLLFFVLLLLLFSILLLLALLRALLLLLFSLLLLPDLSLVQLSGVSCHCCCSHRLCQLLLLQFRVYTSTQAMCQSNVLGSRYLTASATSSSKGQLHGRNEQQEQCMTRPRPPAAGAALCHIFSSMVHKSSTTESDTCCFVAPGTRCSKPSR
jgi:hypothetical protein